MLSDLQKKKLTRYFRVYDVDDDGHIGPADFERVVENARILHGLPPDSPGHLGLRRDYLRRWESLRESADADHDGGVDLGEWLGYWEEVLDDPERYEREARSIAARIFRVFDTDEDGVIGENEFCDFYSLYGLRTELARDVFGELDADHDGAITFSELMEVVHQFYREDDPDAPGNRLFGPYA